LSDGEIDAADLWARVTSSVSSQPAINTESRLHRADELLQPPIGITIILSPDQMMDFFALSQLDLYRNTM